ncbi:hypothetical protein IscW_ISCW001835 [Ixodes scapularis]|uniref:Secreted protein n=1 Tax=Ixodes scapularis TaxID=6945 RepID=B7PCF0_IXOSC|nr:hypothetical protein IscW_ISCW001835 [Ixodes scapularis]|eukprot:XP_002409760.1 hypothetical protein IscW_ISCW001835 [Ixodes scapularis]
MAGLHTVLLLVGLAVASIEATSNSLIIPFPKFAPLAVASVGAKILGAKTGAKLVGLPRIPPSLVRPASFLEVTPSVSKASELRKRKSIWFSILRWPACLPPTDTYRFSPFFQPAYRFTSEASRFSLLFQQSGLLSSEAGWCSLRRQLPCFLSTFQVGWRGIRHCWSVPSLPGRSAGLRRDLPVLGYLGRIGAGVPDPSAVCRWTHRQALKDAVLPAGADWSHDLLCRYHAACTRNTLFC